MTTIAPGHLYFAGDYDVPEPRQTSHRHLVVVWVVAIARVAATGVDLREERALDAIADGFAEWYSDNPPDVGIQTAQVLSAAGRWPSRRCGPPTSRPR